MSPQTVTVEEVLARVPGLYPEAIRIPDRMIEFCPMTRETFRRSPFLDHRIVRAGDTRHVLSFSALHAARPPAHRPVLWLFHGAFCCSTLLTRHIDALGDRFHVLREPHALYELATVFRFRGTALCPPVPEVDRENLFDLLPALLSMPPAGSSITVIKPSDGCANLMERLLALHPESRAIVQYTGFERFVTSVLRVSDRHEWARIRARELSFDVMRAVGRVEVDPTPLDIPETAALVWVLHMDRFRALCEGSLGARVRALEAERLTAAPAATLQALASHCGWSLAPGEVERALDREAGTTHAKSPSLGYDSAARERDQEVARERHAVALERARRWAIERFGPARCDVALPALLV